jgi:hypothetical protein
MDTRKLVNNIVPLIEAFKQNPNLELEGSLGVHNGEIFTSGVDFSYFKALHSVFNTGRESDREQKDIWSQSEIKSHFASFFYKGDVRGRYNVRDSPVFVRKIPVLKCDLNCKSRSYDIRISLKEEQPVKNYLAKDTPEYVRLHERWSFTYKEAWRYDFTKVASGTSKELACKSEPVFEIELELLRNSTFLNSTSNDQIAIHIIEKLIDLLGRFDANQQPLPISFDLI